ncbi:MAG: VanW family protein [Patescibacteria group bacterium]|nr:VanW family protein [Patescibacteria group bacterium]
MTENNKLKIQSLKLLLTWANVTVAVTALAVLMVVGSLVAYGRLYEDRLFPGVRVFGVRVDGLTKSEARQAVQDSIDGALRGGLRFRFRGRDLSLDAMTVATDPDAARDLIRFGTEQAVEDAFMYGRDSGWRQDISEQVRVRVVPKNFTAQVNIDEAGIALALDAAVAKDLDPVQDAMLAVSFEDGKVVTKIEAEKTGSVLVSDAAIKELNAQAAELSFKPIELSERSIEPTIKYSDLEGLEPKATEMLYRPNLVFTYGKSRFEVPTSTLASWVTVTSTSGEFGLTLDALKFSEGVRAIAKAVEVEGKNGSLVVKDGKIESFVAGTEGIRIKTDELLRQVLADWPPTSTFALTTEKIPATLVGEDPEKIGIRELIGVGTSDFSGSPVNRRKNIARGVQLLNGTIVEPDQVFSLVDTMGEIDGPNGWYPEMVIKGDKTLPEYGGGLCQIGTTAFRGAMDSGLPIVERQNHSYRVRYYEPAGTDATIYGPHPDLKFKNDTGNKILINAYVKGDILIFEFWGTRDGRIAQRTDPHIYNITAPPPTKLVETLDLAPGKKKCSEIAHWGADADFTYTVKMPDGQVLTQVFRSHYRPWQAVCLIGVEKLGTETATSTTGG